MHHEEPEALVEGGILLLFYSEAQLRAGIVVSVLVRLGEGARSDARFREVPPYDSFGVEGGKARVAGIVVKLNAGVAPPGDREMRPACESPRCRYGRKQARQSQCAYYCHAGSIVRARS